MYRLIENTVNLLCPFTPIKPSKLVTLTKTGTMLFSASMNGSKTIYKMRQGQIPVTFAGSITNTCSNPITIQFIRKNDTVTQIIKAGSSFSFIYSQVFQVNVIGHSTPSTGELRYQSTYKKYV